MAEAAHRATAPLPHDDRLLGTCLGGRFFLRELIGSGAYGRVYRAEQVTLRRDVAVKILEPRLARDPDFVDQLHAEALITSRLSHPNIVSVIDFGRTDEGLVYIVMEYLRGGTLTELNAQVWPMPLARVGAIMQQILHGLAEAHALGIVHSDLKSDNILVEQRTAGDLVKVVDFGIARLLEPLLPRVQGHDPKTGTISGTPEYMAPEVIRGQKPAPTADLYAAGILLYQLLAGRLPFTHQSFMKVLRSHLEDPVPALAVARPDGVPPSWETLLHRAMAKSPAARFQSATEFRDAIEAALQASDAPVIRVVDPVPDPVIDEPVIDEPVIDEPDQPGTYSHFDRAVTEDFMPVETPMTLSAPPASVPPASVPLPGPHTDAPAHPAPIRARIPAVTPLGSQSLPVVGNVDDQPTAPCVTIEGAPALATTLDFCLGGGSRYALQITTERPEIASAIAATAFDRLNGGVRVCIVRADVAGKPRRWHPIRALLRSALGLPVNPDPVALHAASVHLGSRARAGLLAVFEDPCHTAISAPRSRSMARIWSIARAVKEAVCTMRQSNEQMLLWFENVHRYDPESREVLRVLCAGYLSADLRAVLTAAEPFDIGIAEGVTRVTWSARHAAPNKPELRL
jgi:serine/threonine protein kinase